MNKGGIHRRSFFVKTGVLTTGLAVAGCSEQQDTADEDDEATESTEEPSSTEDPSESEPAQEEEDASEAISENNGPNFEYLHGIAGQTYPSDIDADGHYQRRYEWNALGYEWWVELEIPRVLEDYYEKRYGRSLNYDMYVFDSYSDPYIQDLADTFEQLGNENNLSEREVVDLAVAFVQELKYTPDEVTTGYNQYTFYPAETLIERGGDCEDSTILLAAILTKMGYGCVLLELPDAKPAHMALGVKGDPSIQGTYYEYDSEKYYFLETTGEGYQIGQMPEFDGSTNANIIDIDPYPTLLYRYETQIKQEEDVSVEVTMFNEGELSANQTTFYAGLENRAEETIASDQVNFGALIPEDGTTETLTLEPTEEIELRMRTAVTTDGNIQAQHVSEWRRPI